MTEPVCRRFLVHGRVQGVFFRASAAREATRLGLRGWAVNLPDGRVEVLCCGPAAGVDAMARWLERGPPAANVEAVLSADVDAATCNDLPDFRTG